MNTAITDKGFETFERAGSKWALLTHEGVEMRPTLHDGVLSLEVSKARGANWHGELRYSPFPVRKGDVFSLTFSARATLPFTFSVWLGQQDDPWASLVHDDNRFGAPMMTTEWQTFAHVWYPQIDEDATRMVFVLGQIDTTVEIAGVALVKTSASAGS